jgi:hypothetical protein
MDELQARVLDARDGLDRWSGIRTLTARVSIDGPFWAGKGWPDIFVDETLELDARREHIVFAPFAADRSSVLDVDLERIVVRSADGEEIEPWDEDGEAWRRLAVTFPATEACTAIRARR